MKNKQYPEWFITALIIFSPAIFLAVVLVLIYLFY